MRFSFDGDDVQKKPSLGLPAVLLSGALAGAAGAAPALATQTSAGARERPSDSGYYTYHYDNARTGWNPTETKLTTATVGSPKFGYIRRFAADSVVYAQPLYVPRVLTGGARRDLVIIATENDSVYAYDANSGALAWHRSFTAAAAGTTAVSRSSVGDCPSIAPTIGISSTPVVDARTQKLYVVAKTQTTAAGNTNYDFRLHALDVRSGADRAAPAEIAGRARLGDGSYAVFNPQRQQNRPGLLLANGYVYVAFGSSCDAAPGSVHGWIFGYDRASLASARIFNTTATSGNDFLGSIWQSTFAPAADVAGNLYFATGNGTFDADKNGRSYGDTVLRLSPALDVAGYFAPRGDIAISNADQDVGSAGVMLVPTAGNAQPHLAVAGVKSGTMYLLDRDRLGNYAASGSSALQEVVLENAPNSLYGGPAYYPGFVYWGAGGQPMQAFALQAGGSPRLTAVSQTSNSFPGEGGEIPAVSSNGTTPGTAVVWATTRPSSQGGSIDLYAYDATNLKKTLFAGVAGTWLAPGDAFLTPTVAGGHVFVPGSNDGVAEFGLR